MNHSWNIKRLGDICTSELGKTRDEKRNKGSFRPYLCAVNVQWDKFELSELKEMRFEDNEYDRYTIRKGDLVICEGGDIGRAAIWDKDEPIHYQNALHRVRFNEGVDSRFILYYLYFLKQTGILDGRYGKGVTIKHLVKSSLLSIPVPVPPIDEQQRIVFELDLLTDIIDKKNAQLRDLDTLAHSIFYEMFGDPVKNDREWPSQRIKESVEEMFLGPFGSALKTDSYVEESNSYCMVYEQKHAIKKTLELDNHFIDQAKFQSLKRFEVRPGDFIMSCRGTIGEIFELPVNAPIGIIHPSLMKIRLKKGVYSPDFFRFVLGKIVAEQNTNGGVIKMAITAKALGNVSIILPPYSLQEKYYDAVLTINTQKACIQESLKQTQLLLDSRMDYYFNE